MCVKIVIVLVNWINVNMEVCHIYLLLNINFIIKLFKMIFSVVKNAKIIYIWAKQEQILMDNVLILLNALQAYNFFSIKSK